MCRSARRHPYEKCLCQVGGTQMWSGPHNLRLCGYARCEQPLVKWLAAIFAAWGSSSSHGSTLSPVFTLSYANGPPALVAHKNWSGINPPVYFPKCCPVPSNMAAPVSPAKHLPVFSSTVSINPLVSCQSSTVQHNFLFVFMCCKNLGIWICFIYCKTNHACTVLTLIFSVERWRRVSCCWCFVAGGWCFHSSIDGHKDDSGELDFSTLLKHRWARTE